MSERLIKLLCAIALAVNALIPAGFMLTRAQGSDGITVVICTGSGPQTILIDSDGQQVPDNQKSGNKRCDYATSGALALADDPPLRLAAEVLYAAIAYRVERQVFRATPKPGALSARGPPVELI